MANLTPTASFDNVIQLETNTVALGGAGGVMNAQAQALLNRTAYLKGVQDTLTATTATLTATVAALQGSSVDVVGDGATAFVRYDQAQSLSDAQKSQALNNLGAKRSGNLISKTASYALALSDFQNAVDLYDVVYLRMNSATATNITIDTTLSSLPNLAEINIRNVGAGLSTLVATGTTLNGNLTFTAQHEVKTLVKVGANEWDVVGVLP